MNTLLHGLSTYDPPRQRQFTVIYTHRDDPEQFPALIRARTRRTCIERFHEIYANGEKIEFILEGEWKCESNTGQSNIVNPAPARRLQG